MYVLFSDSLMDATSIVTDFLVTYNCFYVLFSIIRLSHLEKDLPWE